MNALSPPRSTRWHALIRIGALVLAAYALLILALMWWQDSEPDHFDAASRARAALDAQGLAVAPGAITTQTLIEVARTLLDKRGGYLSNDKLPPGLLMDNMPAWEYGVLTQVRDLSKAFRNDFSRSQTQSVEDTDLAEADPLFSSPNDRWLLPSSESQYRKGIGHVQTYLERLVDPAHSGTHFHVRADNLADWLALVEKRLGSLSQRLSASAGQAVLHADPALELENEGVGRDGLTQVRTPWLQIDNVFYEARGSTWALLHFLRAIEADFDTVLHDKNALVSLRQIIRELEQTQTALGSPIVLNGAPFGFFANHSLVMANYISRANAAIIDLRRLLERG